MQPKAGKALRIPSKMGELEALWIAPTTQPNMAAVVCHPLPTHGGTMHNKVVHSITQVFALSGMGVMRFNTRGTGTSDGTFDNGLGETDDLSCVVDYLQQQSITQLWLAGFSFGSFLAYNLLRIRPDLMGSVNHLVMAGPPVARFDYAMSAFLPFPVTLLQGEADEVVDPKSVYQWADLAQIWMPHFELIRFPDCSHFFHGRLIELKQKLTQQLALNHPNIFHL